MLLLLKILPFLLVLFSLSCATPTLQQGRQRTRTTTFQVIRPGSIFITSADLAYLRLGRAGVTPQAYINLEILNATFSTDLADCRDALGNYADLITGPDWLPSELFADVPVTQPSESSNKATIHLRGSALFNARSNVGAEYKIRMPSVCTSQMLSAPVSFKIAPTPASKLSEILAFSVLLSGTLGFLAVTMGASLFAYVPVQMAVFIVSCGCAPLDLQLESYTVGFTLAPLPYTSRDRMPHYHMVLTNLFIFVILTGIETVHFLLRWISTPAYAVRLMASLKGRRDAFLSNYAPAPDEKNPIPPEDVPKRPMPFYFLFCMYAILGGGLVYHSIRVLSFEAKDIKHYGAAAIGLVVWFVFFGLCLSLSLTKGAYYKPFASTKKVLPRLIAPEGTTGPNVFRLSFGVVVGDMRQGRRYASTFPLIYIAIFAILIGATSPSTTGCRTTLSLAWLLTFLFGLFLYRSKPLRSTIANVFAVGEVLAALAAISSLLVYGGYGGVTEDADHWSGRVTVIATIVLSLLSTLSSLVTFAVVYYEFSGSEAHRTAKYSDGRGGILSFGNGDNGSSSAGGGGGAAAAAAAGTADGSALGATGAEQFERHVAFIVGEMKSIIDDGGGQPLEPDETPAGGRGAGGAFHLQAPTLAQFLIQDFEALPAETQQGIVTSDRLARQGEIHYTKSHSPASFRGGLDNSGQQHQGFFSPPSQKRKKAQSTVGHYYL